MIAIDHVLVSDELVEEQFVCDLAKCKGGCCVDGDAGAPLEQYELELIDEVAEAVKPYLSPDHVAEIEQQGHYVIDKSFGLVTPTIGKGICVYGITDENGIVKCGIEQAFNDGKINWQKPISCHLFPATTSQSKNGKLEYLNYEPRPVLCKPACRLGKKLKVPVYEFLKAPIIRRYGQEFYNALQAVAKDYMQASGGGR